MTIVIYTKVAKKVSGVQTLERILAKRLSPYAEVLYVYDVAEAGALDEIGQYATLVQNKAQHIPCDVCIFSSIFQGRHGIIPSYSIQLIHIDLHAWDIKYTPTNVDKFVAVSEAVQNSLLVNSKIESEVIHNLLDTPKIDKVLRLVTASRITQGKGFERMVTIAKEMKKEGLKFVWEIYGASSIAYMANLKMMLRDIPEVVFLGEQTAIQSYMQYADYVVQLSDSEGFCYSVYEALQIGKPVLVTDWAGVRQAVTDGLNGYILSMDLSNLDVNKIFYNIPKGDIIEVPDDIAKWLEILNIRKDK